MNPYSFDPYSLTNSLGTTPESLLIAVLLFFLFYLILGLVSLFSQQRALRMLISLAFTLVIISNPEFMAFFVPFVQNLIYLVAILAIILFFGVLLKGRNRRKDR